MSAVANVETMDADAFLEWVAHQDDRFELADGEPIRMMAGASEAHVAVAASIMMTVGPMARRKGCKPGASDMAVQTGPNGIRYPDFVVECSPSSPNAKKAANPVLIVEISSPSTSNIDATDKLDEYRSLDSVDVVMLIDPGRVDVVVHRRGDDGTFHRERYGRLADTIALPGFDAVLTLGEIYDTLDVEERFVPVVEATHRR